MQRITIVLMAVVGWLVFAGNVRAQDTTNAPRTNLEAFDAQTGTVIVRGSAVIGTIEGQTGTVSVRCRESVQPSLGAKEYGIAVELQEANHAEDTTTVDYDELNSFLDGLDKLGKANHTVTSLPNFDVLYTTGGGLRADVYTSDRRSGAVQAALQSSRSNRARVLLTVDQLAHFRSLVQQAKSRLDQLRDAK
jgi:hypothetical protein